MSAWIGGRPWLLSALLLLGGCASNSSSSQGEAPETGGRDSGAVHAIVDAARGQLFGAAAGDGWLRADSSKHHLEGGETYRAYALTGLQGEGVGSAPNPPEETCTNPTIHMQPERTEAVVALEGAWNAMPRVPARQDPGQTAYRDAVAERLRSHGIGDPEVQITQILRVDLEGDGTEEVLISANLRRGMGTSAEPGDYALVVLRRVVDGEVVSVPLREEYYSEGCVAECAPAVLRIAAILDANGDGVMEVILSFEYYEGEGQALYALDGPAAEEVLSWRCGV